MGARILPLRRVAGRTEELSDESLLAACALGDRAALGALFDRHCDAVRGFVSSLAGREPLELDDVVQRVFETVQRVAHRFERRAEPRTWILGIARNVARHELRARGRRRRLELELLQEQPQAGADLDEQLIREQRLLRLRAALQGLSPALRECFVLVYVQGLSGTEAAKVLGVREGAVWKNLCVARQKLRLALGEEP